ncbi:MAG TPA: nucleotidyltransferase family protein [Pyrinomonadaceae bacterium]|nr:nucleotidyltransferase family protein [Pyrinomonadaceae bacterium]
MRDGSHGWKLGNLIAAVLAGSWRSAPTPLEISAEELAAVTPSLLETGAGALGWRKVCDSELRFSESALQLGQAYRMHALKAAMRERDIGEAFALFDGHEIHPVLVKGWAIARLYPHTGLRPYGDIDLCVRPDQYEKANALLESEGDKRYKVDLHRGFEKFDRSAWDEMWTRSQVLEMNGGKVRVLCAEDHFRLLCLHLLREGAWRPLWLCDIAVAIESCAADFDWDLCLGRNRRQKEWVACTIALAQKLLHANVEGVTAEACADSLPRWLLPSVLKAWEVRAMYERHKAPISSILSYPIYALRRLHHHWPNPIEGTIGMNGSFNEWPRLPFQLGNCLVRTADFFLSLPKTGRTR